MNMLRNFLKGLRKSFDGKDYLREVHRCKDCGEKSWSIQCQVCEMKDVYNGKYDKKKK